MFSRNKSQGWARFVLEELLVGVCLHCIVERALRKDGYAGIPFRCLGRDNYLQDIRKDGNSTSERKGL